MAMEKRTDMGSIKIRIQEFRRKYGRYSSNYRSVIRSWSKLVGKYKNKKVVAIETDLSNESSYDGLIKRLENEKPKVKVLINNAGYEKSGKFVGMGQEDILNMISVNIKGMTLIQRIILPYMQKGSYTIITCSVSSFAPVPNQTVYSATKKYVYYFGNNLRYQTTIYKINTFHKKTILLSYEKIL